ncbi:MAG: acyl carrier protein [Eggerthellales bacterium]|nr:acyl carrier protein [Eggerthellales bacterium]
MSTIETLRNILVETMDVDAEAVTEDATLDDLGIDSLDMTEIMCEVEDVFGIDFGEPEGLETVGQMVTHIEGLL